jgi:hypothetical protein
MANRVKEWVVLWTSNGSTTPYSIQNGSYVRELFDLVIEAMQRENLIDDADAREAYGQLNASLHYSFSRGAITISRLIEQFGCHSKTFESFEIHQLHKGKD